MDAKKNFNKNSLVSVNDLSYSQHIPTKEFLNNSNEYLIKQDIFDDETKKNKTDLVIKQYGGDSLTKNKRKNELIVDYSEVDNIVKCVEHLKGSLDLDDIDESEYPSIESFNETEHKVVTKIVSLVDVFQYTGLRDIATIFRINKYCVKVIKDSKFYTIYFFKKWLRLQELVFHILLVLLHILLFLVNI